MNLLGLSAGLTCAIVIFLWVQDELKMDRFHEKDSRIYQVMKNKQLPNEIETVESMPGVEQVSVMGGIELPGASGFTSVMKWEGKAPGTKVGFGRLEVGYDLFEMLGYEMKEGRTFSRDFSSGKTDLIFNESAIQSMGLKDPVGKMINYKDVSYQIIGVVKDFHFESLYEKVRPCFFVLAPNTRNMVIKLQSGKEQPTIARLQQLHAQFNQGLELDYKFLDKRFEALYTSETRVRELSRYFAILAILISCLGLFGLAASHSHWRGMR